MAREYYVKVIPVYVTHSGLREVNWLGTGIVKATSNITHSSWRKIPVYEKSNGLARA